MIKHRSTRLALEQSVAIPAVIIRPKGRNPAHELDPGLVEPSDYFAEGMLWLVRVRRAGPARCGSHAPVQPHDDVAAGLDQRDEFLVAAVRIARVVQGVPADDDVELLWPQRRTEQVHLHEANTAQPVLLAERFAELQRVQADVGPDYLPAGDTQEVGQVTRAAANVQDDAVVGDRLVEAAGVRARARFLDQRPHRIVIIVVGEGRFLVERLDPFRHIARIGDLPARPEELGNVVGTLERVPAFVADQPAVGPGEPAVAARAREPAFEHLVGGVVFDHIDPSWLGRLGEDEAPHAQHVDLRRHERLVCFARGTDDGVPAEIEAGVDHHRAARFLVELLHELVQQAVALRIDGLDSRRVVHVRDGGDGRPYLLELVDALETGELLRNALPLRFADRCNDQHVGALERGGRVEILAHVIGKNHWREGAESFAELHLHVHGGLHSGVTSIAEDAS